MRISKSIMCVSCCINKKETDFVDLIKETKVSVPTKDLK